MKRFVFLSILYIYLETGLCIEETNISPVEEHTDDAISKRSPALTLVKRNTALKRLPAWSVYYGKRSDEPIFGVHNTGKIEDITNDELLDEDDSDSGEVTLPRSWMNNYQETLPSNDWINLESDKRSNLKRLQPWMSTYGKRSNGFLDAITGYDIEGEETNADIGLNDQHNLEQVRGLSKDVYDKESGLDMDSLQDSPTWPAKRLAGWSATYGKRAPWSTTYGKRALWSTTYGKRSPWSTTYGKRAPWSTTYGKRAPWSTTYGKRAPWSTTYGKRAPWATTYGKRAPWSVTYGKRVPWSATYGKRSQAWQAFYGKRNADESQSEVLSDVINNSENNGQKRSSQAWNAFYGR